MWKIVSLLSLALLALNGCDEPIPDTRLECGSEVAISDGGYEWYRWHPRKNDPSGFQCFIEDRLRAGFFIESHRLVVSSGERDILIYDPQDTPEDIKARLK